MISFKKIRAADLGMILDWRTSEEVTRYMFTDIGYDLENQKKWFQRISDDPGSRYWLVYRDDTPFGLVNLTEIDMRNGHCYWGYYIGEPEYRILGGIIPAYVYNHVFNDLEFNKAMGMVMDGNDNIMKIHESYGCRRVGVLEKHIRKYGVFHDVHLFELLRSKWNNTGDRYANRTAAFE